MLRYTTAAIHSGIPSLEKRSGLGLEVSAVGEATVYTAVAMRESGANKKPASGCTLQRKTPSVWAVPLLILMMPGLITVAETGRDQVGNSGVYSKAAVATDAGVCSTMGVNILKKGGSAVDAAISSLLCVGVINLHSTGIGGGGFMLFYDATSKEVRALDYREVAPNAASYDMYDDLDPAASHVGE